MWKMLTKIAYEEMLQRSQIYKMWVANNGQGSRNTLANSAAVGRRTDILDLVIGLDGFPG